MTVAIVHSHTIHSLATVIYPAPGMVLLSIAKIGHLEIIFVGVGTVTIRLPVASVHPEIFKRFPTGYGKGSFLCTRDALWNVLGKESTNGESTNDLLDGRWCLLQVTVLVCDVPWRPSAWSNAFRVRC
jgi:hypothetical protein